MDRPPPEAYSRYSDPLKYVPVADALDPLVAELVVAYDATVEPLPVAPEDDRVVRALRVVPCAGAPLVFEVTMLPGILARRGWWVPKGGLTRPRGTRRPGPLLPLVPLRSFSRGNDGPDRRSRLGLLP